MSHPVDDMFPNDNMFYVIGGGILIFGWYKLVSTPPPDNYVVWKITSEILATSWLILTICTILFIVAIYYAKIKPYKQEEK